MKPLEILIVEDKIDWRIALAELYRRLGGPRVKITMAASLREALLVLEPGRFDLISLDILLGDGDGRTLLRKARDRKACRGVLVVTGMHQDDNIEVLGDEGRLATMTLDSAVERYFENRRRLFFKDLGCSVEENLSKMAKGLSYRDLLQISEQLNVFRLEGEVWKLTFAGKRTLVENLKGMHYISYLLASSKGIEATRLLAARDGSAKAKFPADSAHASSTSMGAQTVAGGDGKLPDFAALDDYTKRAEEIEGELIEAREFNDLARKDSLLEELEWVHQEVRRARGLSGRTRQNVNQDRDRIRKSISKAIRTSIDRIATTHPELARHLDESISRGNTCCYQPAVPIEWKL